MLSWPAAAVNPCRSCFEIKVNFKIDPCVCNLQIPTGTLLIAVALTLYVGRVSSLDRFSELTQGLQDRFRQSQYPLTKAERQLTPTVRIPEKKWIVMYGDMEQPRFWQENVRNCEIGTGIDKAAMTCELYFVVKQSKYLIYGNPSVAIEYFADDRAPNEQLAIWFREFLIKEYDVEATTSEFSD